MVINELNWGINILGIIWKKLKLLNAVYSFLTCGLSRVNTLEIEVEVNFQTQCEI